MNLTYLLPPQPATQYRLSFASGPDYVFFTKIIWTMQLFLKCIKNILVSTLEKKCSHSL